MKEFELGKFTNEAEGLLRDVKAKFRELEMDSSALPVTMQSDDGPIKLVFVGQYSAGKSSIIKMLTGIDTGIGAAITTQHASTYHWNNLEVIDTPGIQTGIRQDHDEITYEEINHAALLVYVVTSEGFDRQIGEHFRKLAIEKKRGANMILVVNKMDRAPEGNTKEQQDIIRDDMRKVIDPLTPEQLYMSFISTQSYGDYLSEDDSEVKDYYLQDSGHDVFIENLNNFVKDKRITSKLHGPLYALDAVLRNVAGSPENDEILDGMEELYKRKRRIIANVREDCQSSIKYLAEACHSDIYSKGVEASQIIREGSSEDDINAELKRAAEEIDAVLEKYNAKFSKIINDAIREVNSNLETEMSSDYARKVIADYNRITVEAPVLENPGIGEAVDKAKKVGEAITKVSLKEGSTLGGSGSVGNLFGMVGSGNLREFGGSLVYDGVKLAGKTFGIKFAPWEALKFTKGIAIFGKVLAVAGALYQIYEFLTSDDKRREAERKIKEAKDEIRGQFDGWGRETAAKFLEYGEQSLAGMFDPEMEKIDDALKSYTHNRELAAKRRKELSALLDREQCLMESIGELK